MQIIWCLVLTSAVLNNPQGLLSPSKGTQAREGASSFPILVIVEYTNEYRKEKKSRMAVKCFVVFSLVDGMQTLINSYVRGVHSYKLCHFTISCPISLFLSPLLLSLYLFLY